MILILMVLILQWNAQSLIAHRNELKNAICDWNEKPDIICIQEIWLQPEKSFFLSGNDFHKKDTISQEHGGCGIFTKKGMATINVITCDQSPLEHQIIEIFEKDTKNKFCIINIYNPCIQIKHEHID